MRVPSRTSAPTPALDQTYDNQMVRKHSRRLTEAHPQVLIIAPLSVADRHGRLHPDVPQPTMRAQRDAVS
jgi:hypothetical protein